MTYGELALQRVIELETSNQVMRDEMATMRSRMTTLEAHAPVLVLRTPITAQPFPEALRLQGHRPPKGA